MCRFSAVVSALLASLSACGDDGANRLPDAPPAPDDAAVDSPAPVTTVNITTLARRYDSLAPGAPRAGVMVFGVSAANTLVSSAVTDAAGKATLSLPDGGSVTAVYDNGGSKVPNLVITYVGVKPGDALTFGDRTTEHAPTTGQTGTMTLSWAPVTNATHYRVYSPCYRTGYTMDTEATIDLAEYCQTPTAPVGLVAYDDSETVLASVLLPAAPYTPGSTLAIAANQWVAQPAGNLQIDLVNLDAAVTDADIGGVDELGAGELGPFWWSYPPITFRVTPKGGTASQVVSVAEAAPRKSAAAKLHHETRVGRIWAFKAATTSPVAIDTANAPWIDTLTLAPDGRTVSWTQTAGTYDAALLRFVWSAFDWTVILPPGVTMFEVPAPPAELAPYLPMAKDEVYLRTCQLVDLASAASYDALRALPEWRATDSERSVRAGEETQVINADCGEGYHF